jgi:prepilin peptidase CpaA
MMPLVVYIFVTIQLIVVSYVDLKIKKISNMWSLLNIGLYFLLLFIFPNEYYFSLNTFIFPTIFILEKLLRA